MPAMGIAQAQPTATKDVKASDHWDEIDERLYSLVEQLAKVEASLDAATSLIEKNTAGADSTASDAKAGEKTTAHESAAASGRKSDAVSRWPQFYTELAAHFYFQPADREQFRYTAAALQNVVSVGTKTTGNSPNSNKPAAVQPPRLDDLEKIYRDSKVLADAELKELPLGELRARRQKWEGEQCALWCQIACRVINAHDLANKPLYHFQPYVPAIGLINVQRTKAMTAGVLFLRNGVEIAVAAERDPAKSMESLRRGIPDACSQLNDCWGKAVSAEELQDGTKPAAKILALGKQLESAALAASDSFQGIVNHTQNNDEQPENSLRAGLQNSLIRYVECTLALDEMLETIAADWNIKSDKFNPLTVRTTGDGPPAKPAPNLALANRIAQSMVAYRDAILSNPNNAQSHKNLAIAMVKQAEAMGETPPWDDAADEFATAVDLSADNSSTISPRKTICRELAQSDELFDHVVQVRPDDTSLWIGRAEYRIQCSQWKEALADLSKVIQTRPIHDDTFEYACLLDWLGDTKTYETFSRELSTRSGQPQNEYAAYIMARVCLLEPKSAIPPEQILGWIQNNSTTEAAAYRLHVLGLAYYRAGQYETAIRYLDKSNGSSWKDQARSMNWLVLAMAYHQLHNAEQTDECVKTAHKMIALAAPKQPGGPVDLFAPDWIEYQVLSRELDEMLQTPPKDSKTRTADK